MLNKAVLVATLASLSWAAVTPTAPGPGEVFRVGEACPLQYTLDTTKTWKNVSIDLMTGPNLNMVFVTNVVSGLDGTKGKGTYSWTCPTVTPNSDIYFYQFTNDGIDPTWTTRFTIASSTGETTPPTDTQPDGIQYGVGALDSGAVSNTTSTTSTTPAADPTSTTTTSSGGAQATMTTSTITTSTASSTTTTTTTTTTTSATSTSSSAQSSSSTTPASGSDFLNPAMTTLLALGAVGVSVLTLF